MKGGDVIMDFKENISLGKHQEIYDTQHNITEKNDQKNQITLEFNCYL